MILTARLHRKYQSCGIQPPSFNHYGPATFYIIRCVSASQAFKSVNAATAIMLHDRIPVGHGHFIGAGTQPPDLAINLNINTKYQI